MVWAALPAVRCKLFQQTQQNKTVCQASKVARQTAVLCRFVFKRLFASIRAARVVTERRSPCLNSLRVSHRLPECRHVAFEKFLRVNYFEFEYYRKQNLRTNSRMKCA